MYWASQPLVLTYLLTLVLGLASVSVTSKLTKVVTVLPSSNRRPSAFRVFCTSLDLLSSLTSFLAVAKIWLLVLTMGVPMMVARLTLLLLLA